MKKKIFILISIVFCTLFNSILLPTNVLANENDNISELEKNNVQKVKVITTKVSESGESLIGATLQILDLEGNIVDEWITDGTAHETMLEDGEYILHEKSAPEGFEIADDKKFTIKVEVHEINSGVDHAVNENCKHYPIPLYYIEIKGQKHEVYCINQDWDEPVEYVYKTDETGNIVKDDNGNPIIISEKTVEYNGEILSVDNIKTFTPDADSTMSNQELYDKLLDIIYHKIKADEIFKDSLTANEIRFITEYALKNYSSGEVTTEQKVKENGEYVTKTIKYFRYYKYDPIEGYIIDPENGDALGKLAQHWKTSHKTIIPIKYVELYNYLISSEDPHPSDMHLYVYSTLVKPNAPNSTENDNFQNLLGISGYYDDFKQQELELTLENKYSDEVTDITITKIWEDNENEDMIRPESVKVNIYADDAKIKDVTVSENDNWEIKISNLPVYNNGKKINYTITEDVIEFYETNITGNVLEGFKITNVHEPWPKGDGDSSEPDKPDDSIKEYEEIKNPQTYNNISTNIVILIASFLGLIISLYFIKKEKN